MQLKFLTLLDNFSKDLRAAGAENWSALYSLMWLMTWNSFGTGVGRADPKFSYLIRTVFEYWTKKEGGKPLEYSMCFITCFGSHTILLSMLVDITIERVPSKTSIIQPKFLDLLWLKLEQCLTSFHTHCLRKAQGLLTDQDDYIGLIDPAIVSSPGRKLLIDDMIKWNDFIRFPFLHSYSPNGNASIDLYDSYSSFTAILVIRLSAGSTTPGI